MNPELEETIKAEVAKARTANPSIILNRVDFENATFVCRAISRLEWRAHLAAVGEAGKSIREGAANPETANVEIMLRNEEDLCIKCVIFPRLDQITIKNYPAGYIETLANSIMASSGFGNEPVITKL